MPNEATDTQEQEATTESNGEFSFETWLGEQPEHVKKGYESHTAGLKSTLEKERSDRKEFARLLKELTPKAEKGSELEKALGETSTRLEQTERKLAFVEEASKPEIGCSNARAAFLVAEADGLFKRSGEPDWAAIKAAAPELFGRKAPPGNAGSGNGSPPVGKADMNTAIRQMAGRG